MLGGNNNGYVIENKGDGGDVLFDEGGGSLGS